MKSSASCEIKANGPPVFSWLTVRAFVKLLEKIENAIETELPVGHIGGPVHGMNNG